MKPWMKAVFWAGLGGGIGFFAGWQVGQKGRRKLTDAEEERAYNDGWQDGYEARSSASEALEKLEQYRGGAFGNDTDGDELFVQPEEEPEMPEDPPEIGDEEDIEEVPELHPQHMIPQLITEDAYYTNPWNYDQEHLNYYETDEVLYNRETRKVIKNKDEMDQIIGIGMIFNFYLKDGEALDAIFVRNDTMGVIFRIDRFDASYQDEIVGVNAPEYEEDEDFTEEDLD